jgi:ABC-type glutathione transport system ATPase component
MSTDSPTIVSETLPAADHGAASGAHGGAVALAAGGPTGVATQGLRLARLHLNGFKSFADKTTFTIDQPITGIVGPNGCGKSNVVDAIKWVLGERSSKSLRGKEMIDVIFAGSAARKPAGMASVSLVFENPERADRPTVEAGEIAEPPAEPVSAEPGAR